MLKNPIQSLGKRQKIQDDKPSKGKRQQFMHVECPAYFKESKEVTIELKHLKLDIAILTVKKKNEKGFGG